MAELPYMSGHSPVQYLNLRREVTKQEMRDHPAHPCRHDFRTVTSGIDGCDMRVLDYAPRYRAFHVSTEYRDHLGYNDEARWRAYNGPRLQNCIRVAGLPSWPTIAGRGDRINHHNRRYERASKLQNVQKERGCYSNEQEWRQVRFTELGGMRALSGRGTMPTDMRPHVGRELMENGETITTLTHKEPAMISARSDSTSARSSGRRHTKA
ncbi:unnamed protein product [Amoebophrya sp. A120]|nr:unnamed protein product [Amoebophrya sp. A120]|eukprot:GSA120T00018926001.1